MGPFVWDKKFFFPLRTALIGGGGVHRPQCTCLTWRQCRPQASKSSRHPPAYGIPSGLSWAVVFGLGEWDGDWWAVVAPLGPFSPLLCYFCYFFPSTPPSPPNLCGITALAHSPAYAATPSPPSSHPIPSTGVNHTIRAVPCHPISGPCPHNQLSGVIRDRVPHGGCIVSSPIPFASSCRGENVLTQTWDYPKWPSSSPMLPQLASRQPNIYPSASACPFSSKPQCVMVCPPTSGVGTPHDVASD